MKLTKEAGGPVYLGGSLLVLLGQQLPEEIGVLSQGPVNFQVPRGYFPGSGKPHGGGPVSCNGVALSTTLLLAPSLRGGIRGLLFQGPQGRQLP